MPPKKAAAPETKALLGRPGNNLSMGIVGLPNVSLILTVGKSSLFNVIAQCDLGKAANFPYATIDPEEARVPIPDERFDWLCQQYKPKTQIPAFLTCIDIAGLTKGASTGAGLGNAFLSHVRAVDGIFQVIRAFDDAEVIHVEGDVDPIRDMEIIQTELRLKDEEWVTKKLEQLKKTFRGTGTASLADKAKKEEIDCVEKVLKTLTVDHMDVRKVDWNNKEVQFCPFLPSAFILLSSCASKPRRHDDKERNARLTQLIDDLELGSEVYEKASADNDSRCDVQIDHINNLQLLTAKPVIYLVNLSERDYVRKKNKWLPKIKAWIDEKNPGDLLIPFSVALEERLQPMSEEEQKAELEKLGTTRAIGKIVTSGYQGLHLIRYFTCGPVEVRAWTIRQGTKAPQAAGVIHSDFENKFVCGEIMSIADLKEYGSESAVKAAGKLMQKGKPYVMVDGDIAYWKHS